MKSAILMLGCLCAVIFCGSVSAQVYELLQVPGSLPVSLKQRLSGTRNLLVAQLNQLTSRADSFNSACASVPADSPRVQHCQSDESELQEQRAEFNRRAERYNRKVMRAGKLSAHSAVVWSARGNVTLTQHGDTMSAGEQPLEIGDCIDVHRGGIAELVLPQFTDLRVGPGRRFCYAPQQADKVIGVLGYLYYWQSGHEIKQPVEVAGVRG